MHEGFDIGWADDADEAPTEGAMSGGNVWPAEQLLPGFKPQVLEY